MRISDWGSDVCSADLPVDFPRRADSRLVAGEHGRTTPVTIHIITSRLNRFDDSLVLLIEGPRLPGAHAVIDLRIVLTKISRRAIEIVADGLGLGRDDVRTQRSEERRVGKEGVSTCKSRWSPYN